MEEEEEEGSEDDVHRERWHPVVRTIRGIGRRGQSERDGEYTWETYTVEPMAPCWDVVGVVGDELYAPAATFRQGDDTTVGVDEAVSTLNQVS